MYLWILYIGFLGRVLSLSFSTLKTKAIKEDKKDVHTAQVLKLNHFELLLRQLGTRKIFMCSFKSQLSLYSEAVPGYGQ